MFPVAVPVTTLDIRMDQSGAFCAQAPVISRLIGTAAGGGQAEER